MKLNRVAIALFLIAFSTSVFSQTKVGTVDTDLILSKMPEFTQVQEGSKKYNAELETELKKKLENYEAKLKVYEAEVKGYSAVMKKTKEDELIRLENEIKQFQSNGTQLLQLKQQELLRPLYEKMAKTIEEVAKSKGYSQILTLGGVELAYFDPTHDITKLVMTKLGIKVE